jgi:DNA polymerase-4
MDKRRIRRIIHIDMDAFYASIEQRNDPALKGRPVAVGYPARWPLQVTRPDVSGCARRCFNNRDEEVRRCRFSSRLGSRFTARCRPDPCFCEYTPLVEPLSLDEAYLDVTDYLREGMTAWATARK